MTTIGSLFTGYGGLDMGVAMALDPDARVEPNGDRLPRLVHARGRADQRGGSRMNVDDLVTCLLEARASLREAEGLAHNLGIGLAIDEETLHVDQLIMHVSAIGAS
jgi:hypothetical protein|nr:MAG TPA: hypothetical protein [Caudoviricetes sp.]